ncbi:transmembrane protein C16orf54 homolog [Ambystoma mexicanum]|uniref:transmembrane protein C16orf54 homolog n=1 Tax=Ambystoma mexicanum TaxID=8296 RepID=UPI0037E848BE
MATASIRRHAEACGTLLGMALLACFPAPILLETTKLLGKSEPPTGTLPWSPSNQTITTSPEINQTMISPTVTTSTETVTTAPEDLLCQRCLIAMVALAIVAGIFMISTVVLCSKFLTQRRQHSPKRPIIKMSARSSPTGSSMQGLWIEPAATMKERSEFWYGGPSRRKENGLATPARGSNEDVDPWAQPAPLKARAARQNSMSLAGTDRHLLAPPPVMLHQISDFWQREGRSDNSSFKAVPSSLGTVSEVGVESNSTEENGSEFFQGGSSIAGRMEVGDSGGGGGEEEELPVVQPKVTAEQISAFWNRSRASEHTFRNGEITLL